ncbi:MAG: metallophosphoesterase [Verrucomicrobiota bacterium]
MTRILPWSLQEAIRITADKLHGERCFPLVEQVSCELPGWSSEAPLRIAILADIHYDPLHEADFVAKVVRRTLAESPDLILLLGDFHSESISRLDELSGILGSLQAPLGCLAVLGNHDYVAGADAIVATLTEQGIHLLRNERRDILPPSGSPLPIIGFESATHRAPMFQLLDAPDLSPGSVLLLAHEPDVFDYSLRHPSLGLQLSGHSHGGQVRVPGLGFPLLPRLGKQYFRGGYARKREDGPAAQLYVNRGIGTGHLHVRYQAPPEITILELRGKTP